MKKKIYYTYLGTNGTITSPVHLEGIYSIPKYELVAEKDKKLTKNNKDFFEIVHILTDDLENWMEVDNLDETL